MEGASSHPRHARLGNEPAHALVDLLLHEVPAKSSSLAVEVRVSSPPCCAFICSMRADLAQCPCASARTPSPGALSAASPPPAQQQPAVLGHGRSPEGRDIVLKMHSRAAALSSAATRALTLPVSLRRVHEHSSPGAPSCSVSLTARAARSTLISQAGGICQLMM